MWWCLVLRMMVLCTFSHYIFIHPGIWEEDEEEKKKPPAQHENFHLHLVGEEFAELVFVTCPQSARAVYKQRRDRLVSGSSVLRLIRTIVCCCTAGPLGTDRPDREITQEAGDPPEASRPACQGNRRNKREVDYGAIYQREVNSVWKNKQQELGTLLNVE